MLPDTLKVSPQERKNEIRGRRSGGYRGSRGEWRSEESGIEGGVKIASHISELVGALSQTGRGETTKRLGMSEIMSSEKISEFGLWLRSFRRLSKGELDLSIGPSLAKRDWTIDLDNMGEEAKSIPERDPN
ncbi:hypothetical protein C5167_042021 [Papaver somniferum]|nr:hypothetical protein C5167_042021 [Papaver somniferum]